MAFKCMICTYTFDTSFDLTNAHTEYTLIYQLVAIWHAIVVATDSIYIAGNIKLLYLYNMCVDSFNHGSGKKALLRLYSLKGPTIYP